MSKHCVALRQHSMCIVDKCTNNNMREKLISFSRKSHKIERHSMRNINYFKKEE